MKLRLLEALVLSALLIGLSQKARADEVWLTLPLHSYHSNRDKDYNEENYGVGLKLTHEDKAVVVGAFKNSMSRTAIYAGVDHRLWLTAVDFGVILGGISGYNNTLVPVLVPRITYTYKEVGITILGIPPFSSKIETVIAVQLEWRFYND